MKIDILGTEYEIKYATEQEYSGLRGRTGCCDRSSKTIHILSDWDTKQYHAWDNVDSVINETKRHEIVHAFLFESGLTEMSNDEVYVDWIAMQFPKLLEAFKAVDASA